MYYSEPSQQVGVLLNWRGTSTVSNFCALLLLLAQRFIIRLIMMVPCYTFLSAGALQVGLPNGVYFETARDCYEAFISACRLHCESRFHAAY